MTLTIPALGISQVVTDSGGSFSTTIVHTVDGGDRHVYPYRDRGGKREDGVRHDLRGIVRLDRQCVRHAEPLRHDHQRDGRSGGRAHRFRQQLPGLRRDALHPGARHQPGRGRFRRLVLCHDLIPSTAAVGTYTLTGTESASGRTAYATIYVSSSGSTGSAYATLNPYGTTTSATVAAGGVLTVSGSNYLGTA